MSLVHFLVEKDSIDEIKNILENNLEQELCENCIKLCQLFHPNNEKRKFSIVINSETPKNKLVHSQNDLKCTLIKEISVNLDQIEYEKYSSKLELILNHFKYDSSLKELVKENEFIKTIEYWEYSTDKSIKTFQENPKNEIAKVFYCGALKHLKMDYEDTLKSIEVERSHFLQGMYYYHVNNYELAIQNFTKDIDYHLSQYFIGKLYSNGRGIEQSFEEALLWYNKAAKQGDLNSINNLGIIHDFGYGTKVNSKKVIKYYEKGCEKNHSNSLNNLGYLYLNGIHVPEKDFNKSLDLFEKSAIQGNPWALYGLAQQYLRGKGCEKDEEKGFSFALRSANKGYPLAMYLVGQCYAEALGIEQDLVQARMWLEKSSYFGCKEGKNYLEKLNEKYPK